MPFVLACGRCDRSHTGVLDWCGVPGVAAVICACGGMTREHDVIDGRVVTCNACGRRELFQPRARTVPEGFSKGFKEKGTGAVQ